MLRNIQNNKKLLSVSAHIATLCTHIRTQWKPHLSRSVENRGIETYFMTMVYDMPWTNCESTYLTSKILETSSKIKHLLNHFIFYFYPAFLSPIILTTDFCPAPYWFWWMKHVPSYLSCSLYWVSLKCNN